MKKLILRLKFLDNKYNESIYDLLNFFWVEKYVIFKKSLLNRSFWSNLLACSISLPSQPFTFIISPINIYVPTKPRSRPILKFTLIYTTINPVHPTYPIPPIFRVNLPRPINLSTMFAYPIGLISDR